MFSGSLKRIYIYFCALIPMFFWGISFVWTKIALKYLSPFTLVFFRLIISAILLVVLDLFLKKSKIDRKDLKLFIVLAFFEPLCYFVGESYGIQYVSSTLASIIISTIPVVTPIFAFLFIKEKLTVKNLAGLFISFLGVVIIIINKNLSLSVPLNGILFLLFAVLSAVGHGIMLKKLSHKYSPVTVVKIQNIIGTIYFVPLFLFFEFDQFSQINPTFELIYTVIALSILCSTLAFIFITIAVRELGVSLTNIFTNTIPLFTAIFAYFMLGEEFGIQKIIGMVTVIGGLVLSQVKTKKPPQEEMVYLER